MEERYKSTISKGVVLGVVVTLGIVVAISYTGFQLPFQAGGGTSSPSPFFPAPQQPTPKVDVGMVSVPGYPDCKVSTELADDSSTVTVNIYDRESDTPLSSTVNPVVRGYQVDSTGKTTYLGQVHASGGTFTSVKIPSIIHLYGGNGTGYVEEQTGICVSGTAETVEMDAHAPVSDDTNLVFQAYDPTTGAELASSQNASEGDYNLTLAADQSKNIDLQLYPNEADKSYNIAGFLTLTINNMDEVEFLGIIGGKSIGLTSEQLSTKFKDPVLIPEFADLQITGAQTKTNDANITGGFEQFVPLSKPILLNEFDELWVKARATCSSTDCVANAAFASADLFIICAVDAVWERGNNGNPQLVFASNPDLNEHYTIASYDTTQSNSAIDENVDTPLEDNTAGAGRACITVHTI